MSSDCTGETYESTNFGLAPGKALQWRVFSSKNGSSQPNSAHASYSGAHACYIFGTDLTQMSLKWLEDIR